MTRSFAFCLIVVCMMAALFAETADAGGGKRLILFDFEEGFDIGAVEANDVDIVLDQSDAGHRLHIASHHHIDWPGITLKPAGERWDVSGYRQLKMDVTNTGSNPVSVGFRIDNPGGDGSKNCVQIVESFVPGEKRTITADLSATSWTLSPPVEIVGMRGAPGQLKIDPADIIQLIVFVPQPNEDHEFAIDAIRAEGEIEKLDADGFFPFIDEFGQYMHRDWPGKLHSEADFAVNGGGPRCVPLQKLSYRE